MNFILLQIGVGLLSHALGLLFGWLLRGAVKDEDKRKKRGINFFISIGVVLLAVLSLATMFVVISEYRHSTNCQAQYNKSYSQALVERQTAAENDRAAARTLAQGTFDMLNVILNPTATADQRRKSIEDYRKVNENFLNTSKVADKKRAENPLPLTPECASK